MHSAAPHVPWVPAREEIQRGYKLPYEEVHFERTCLRVFQPHHRPPDDAPSVLCVPGLGASGRSFAPMSPLGARWDLRFLTLPYATPLQETPIDHALRLLASPVLRLPERFTLVGSSYGSLLALAFAVRHPERVRGLVMVSPVASTRRIRRPAMVVTTFLRVPLPFAFLFAPAVARILGGRRMPEEARAEIVREARRLSPLEMGRRLRDILGADLLPALPALQVPTLVVHGTRDWVVPPANARDVAARIPNARLELIRGAAHLPYMSHPEAFNAAVAEFLRSLPP